MDQYRRLGMNIRRAVEGKGITVYQGIVRSIEGMTCTVTFGSLDVDGVRLKASVTDTDDKCIIVPKPGSAVIVGSLSGDLNNLVVLSVDEVREIVINGGRNGGLVNIASLTDSINRLVDAFNSHTHPVSGAVAGTVATPMQHLDKDEYEDNNIRH